MPYPHCEHVRAEDSRFVVRFRCGMTRKGSTNTHPTGVGSLHSGSQVKRKITSSRRRTHPAELRGASAPDVWPIGTLRGLLL